MDELRERLNRLQGYLRADSQNFPLLAEAGDLALQAGEWELAADLVQRALALKPEDPVSRYRQLVILLQSRRHQDALAISTRLLAEGHHEAPLQYAHARALVMGGAYEEAVPILTGLMETPANTGDFPALVHLTIRSLHAVGRVDEAIALATAHLDAHPEDALAEGMASLIHFDNGDLDRARELSRAALARSPSNLDALLAAGSVALGLEQDEAAKAHFSRATALHGENGRAWLGLGMASMRENKLDEAKAEIRRAIECMPRQLASYNILAWIHIFEQDYTAARQTLEQCLAIDPTFSETHGTLAVVAAHQGSLDEARQLSEKAVRLDAESFAGRYAQTLVLEQSGQPAKGEALLGAIFKGTTLPGGGNLADAVQRYMLRR